jgi:hypothetical protein
MAARMLKLTVVKADGTTEEYFHTKVMGAIANALSAAGQADVAAAEELAEAVTFFLYRAGSRRSTRLGEGVAKGVEGINSPSRSRVSAGEILSVIETVLAATGFEEPAVALSEHHFQRKMRRNRIEVIGGRLHELADAGGFYEGSAEHARSRWDKSRIVEDLVAKHGLPRQTARAVASMAEEKVFNMGLTLVPAGLVEQLVLNDAATMIHAQQQLQI